MFDRDDLQAAVAARIFKVDQVEAFERFMATRLAGADGHSRVIGQEDLRFLRNFNDIFLSIGLVILVSGVMAGLSMALAGSIKNASATALAAGVITAAIVWLLAEYFVGKRRLLLPGITLTVAFAVLAAVVAGVTPDLMSSDFEPNPQAIALVVALTGLASYLRFRLPFALGMVAVALAGAGYLSLAEVEGGGQVFHIVLLASGFLTLVAAVWYDQRDPARVTRFSDNGFWLHLAAAPQIVMGALGLAGVEGGSLFVAAVRDMVGDKSTDTVGMAAVVIVVIGGLALLALALNRRALILSGLISFGTALGVLFTRLGLDASLATIFALLALGGLVTLLGGGWSTARRGLLRVLPRQGIWGRVFPPEPNAFVNKPA